MDEFDRREERKERIKRKRIAKEERKRRRAEARDDHATHKRRTDEREDSDSDDAAAGQQIVKPTTKEVPKPKLYNDCLQKYWWDENNRVRCGVYNVQRPKNFPARFTGELDEFVYVQVPSSYVGMQRYEPGRIMKMVAEDIYEIAIRDGIKVFASKDQLRKRFGYSNIVEAHDDFPIEVLTEEEDKTEAPAEAAEEMVVDEQAPRPTFWLVTVYRKYVVINDGTTDDWFDLTCDEEWTRLEEYATLLRYKRSSTQGIRILDCFLDEDNIRRLVKSLLYFNISTIEFPWMPRFLQQECNEPFRLLIKANEMTLRSVINFPCLTDVPCQLFQEANKMSARLCYGDATLFSITDEYSDGLSFTVTIEGIKTDVRADAWPEIIRKRTQHLRIKSEVILCEESIVRVWKGLSEVEPLLPNVQDIEVEMTHTIDECDYCFDTNQPSDVDACSQSVIEEMAKIVDLVDTKFIWLPTVKSWNFTINFRLRTHSDYFEDEENKRCLLRMIDAKIMMISWYFAKEEHEDPNTVKASFDVSSNKKLTAMFEILHLAELEAATDDRKDYEDYVQFHKGFSA